MTGEQAVPHQVVRVREYLLDSTVLIGYLRGFHDAVLWVDGLLNQPVLIGTTAVNVAEIEAGKRTSDTDRTDEFLSKLYVYTITAQMGRYAGEWIRELRAKGIILHLPDCLVASVAYQQGLTLVTHNIKGFPMLRSDQLLKPW